MVFDFYFVCCSFGYNCDSLIARISVRISFDISICSMKPMFARRGGCISNYVCMYVCMCVASKATHFTCNKLAKRPWNKIFICAFSQIFANVSLGRILGVLDWWCLGEPTGCLRVWRSSCQCRNCFLTFVA